MQKGFGCSHEGRMLNATGAVVVHPLSDPVKTLVTITGGPRHDVINVNRLASAACTDKANFCYDHADMMNRLSAPRSPLMLHEQYGMPEEGPTYCVSIDVKHHLRVCTIA